MSDHEDYLPGEAPASHHGSHEFLGTDEISIAGLSGESIELAAHKILPSIHHVRFTPGEARDAINNIFGADGRANANINLDGHKLENVAAAVFGTDGVRLQCVTSRISTHADLPTVHQDAPALIATHSAIAAAHHAKYTNAEARAVHSPLSVSAHDFIPSQDTYDFVLSSGLLRHRTTLTVQYFDTGIILPHGVTVTKVTLFGWRDDAAASLVLYLIRANRAGGISVMASVSANWTTGYSSRADTTITNPVIDNINYD